MPLDINEPLVGITLFVATIAFVYFARTSPLLYGPKAGAKKGGSAQLPEARELEIKVRMKSGVDVLDDMLSLIKIYCRHQHYEDAERYCRRALQIAEEALGRESEALLPILHEQARALTGLRRKVEADKVKERAKQISKLMG
jgi:hypothetical protein